MAETDQKQSSCIEHSSDLNINKFPRSKNEIPQEIAEYLSSKIKTKPKIGIICGSGLGTLAEEVKAAQYFPYKAIPHFPVSTVQGHSGQLVFGFIAGVSVVCMQGRFHYFEGYTLWQCSLPVRVMRLLGVSHLIVSNAAGGLSAEYNVGDVMVLRDHINMMGFAGNSPLLGPNDESFGPRFPTMVRAYDADLRNLMKEVAFDVGLKDNLHEGVYACVGGPHYETVAELKLLKILGADAVGMSTVPEVITARHCNMAVVAFSLITNTCPTDYDGEECEIKHDDVVDVGRMRQDVLKKMVSGFVERISKTLS